MKTEQPFTLNHEGKTFGEAFGSTQEERNEEIEKNVYGDVAFGVFLLGIFSEQQDIGVVVATVLSGILGVDLNRPSEVAEYIVRTVPEGKRRKDIYHALDFAKFGSKVNAKDAITSILGELIKKTEKAES